MEKNVGTSVFANAVEKKEFQDCYTMLEVMHACLSWLS